ncbi:hypothetical protein Tco_1114579 [Tanacetum coccineum]|uniref:Integrase, catalytic region, zinc finger, CCHC-type, peptidase aspartic, catalytic n=1 Tax=Tanacetum coccineum TaxID=301880 RepID=A0ABQ5IVH4_9ASTR
MQNQATDDEPVGTALQCPSAYNTGFLRQKGYGYLKFRYESVIERLSLLILFIADLDAQDRRSNLSFAVQFLLKILSYVVFGNDQFVPILGYGDLVHG